MTDKPNRSNHEGDKLLTLKEASALTRVPIGTLHRWRSTQDPDAPKSFKVGRRVVVWESEIHRWLKEQEAKG